MEPTGYAYVTTLDFDETGSFLAAGYSDGTLLVYHRPPDDSKFKVYVRFISHEAEIVNVKWCKGISCNLLLLASDVNTTKLWKISRVSRNPAGEDNGHLFSNVKIVLRRVFFQAPPQGSTMNCNLHSVSLNSDGEVFLTADELRIYLWNLQAGGKECFSVLDLAAELRSMQMVTEVMRTAVFHPQQCNLLAYGTSTGAVRMCDLRTSALCEGLGKALPAPSTNPTPTKNSLAEYMVGISDLAFDPCAGHLLAARDYNGVTVWDLRTNSQHLARYSILPSFRKKLMSHLYDRYEAGAPLERFKCCFSRSPNSSLSLITGTYDDRCVLWDITTSSDSSPLPTRHKTLHVGKPKHPPSLSPSSSLLEFSDSPTSNNFSLGWRRKLAKHGGRRREEGQEGEVVDIFPDEGEGGEKGEGGAWTEGEKETTYYQNGSGVVSEFGEHTDYFGGEADYNPNGYFSVVGEEEGGVVGEYNSTPEFLAVVPFSNSCISYFTGEDEDGGEEQENSQLSPMAFFSKVSTLATDQQGESLAVAARGSLFVYNIAR